VLFQQNSNSDNVTCIHTTNLYFIYITTQHKQTEGGSKSDSKMFNFLLDT